MKRSTFALLRPTLPAVALVLALGLAGHLPVRAQEEAPPSPSLSLPVKDAVVTEVFASDIYTYLKVNTPSGVLWIVTPVCVLGQGQKVSVLEGKYYPQIFNEKLGLTFDNLVVATKLTIDGKEVGAFAAHDLPSGCIAGRPAK